MARNLEDIQKEVFDAVAADAVLAAKLTSESKVSVWKLLVYIVSFAIFMHELIVEKNAENSRPHTKRWYREQALAYMDGHELIWKDGQFKYDTSGMSEAQIAESKPVTHVAITEAANGVLIVKTATFQSGGTGPLSPAVHGRFMSYMGQIKDAGNRLQYINQAADDLRVSLRVWVDDLIIDLETGESLITPGTFPVNDACKAYLNQLEFNGAFVKTFLVDAIQKVNGVKIPKIETLEHRTLANPFELVEEYILPFSGHFRYDVVEVEYRGFWEI